MVGLHDLADIDSTELFDGLEAFIDDVSKQGSVKKIYLISTFKLRVYVKISDPHFVCKLEQKGIVCVYVGI